MKQEKQKYFYQKMKTEYKYILEKGSKKYPCPNCGKRSFVRYISTETKEYLPRQYGRCDRESKCAYHLNPYLDGYLEMRIEQNSKGSGLTKVSSVQQKYFSIRSGVENGCNNQPLQKNTYFDFITFKKTLRSDGYERNTFIQNLLYQIRFPFQSDEVTQVIELYRLGTITEGYRAGAVSFPFIDFEGNIRTIQVKEFDKDNHTTGTDFLHSMIEKEYIRNKEPLPEWLKAYLQNEKKVSCLFGEHLLKKHPFNPVALVEAPKTAVYGSLYFGLPEQSSENLIWLAVYNKSSFSLDKLKVLRGRKAFIFPDLSKEGNTYKEWETKAREIENKLPGVYFIFSDLLERLAPDEDKNNGCDLADYLIQQDWQLFRKQTLQKKLNPKPKYQNEVQLFSESEKILTYAENINHQAELLKTVEPDTNLIKAEILIGSNKKGRRKESQKIS